MFGNVHYLYRIFCLFHYNRMFSENIISNNTIIFFIPHLLDAFLKNDYRILRHTLCTICAVFGYTWLRYLICVYMMKPNIRDVILASLCFGTTATCFLPLLYLQYTNTKYERIMKDST